MAKVFNGKVSIPGDKIDEENQGQVESAGKSRQRVRGESPRIVKVSDQLWPPSHASATRKGSGEALTGVRRPSY